MRDIVVLLPGITGSVLKKNGRVVWGFGGKAIAGTLLTRGRSLVDALALTDDSPDREDLGDGVVADALAPDLHLLPGLWKIDGYSRVADVIQSRFAVREGENFFPFPYDWRRDNRAAARKLARESAEWLRRRRQVHPDAKLILVAHSMGGLVSRYYLEVLGGWRDTRALITFGTPYRGSLNALDSLANGSRKGPFGLIDLSELIRSLTAVYQLLPIYQCYDAGDGKLVRVGETSGIPQVDASKAKAALAFHREIEAANQTNRNDPEYQGGHYAIFPVVGIGQETGQSGRRNGGAVDILRDLGGEDLLGDGTVPRVSATPIEFPRDGGGMFAATKHASLQNADAVGIQLEGVLSSLRLDLGGFREAVPTPASKVALAVEDLYWLGEPIQVRARCEREDAKLTATLTADTGLPVATQAMTDAGDGWRAANFAPPEAGAYSVEVAGSGVEPAADAFAVADTNETRAGSQ
jgi:hypothetical protein